MARQPPREEQVPPIHPRTWPRRLVSANFDNASRIRDFGSVRVFGQDGLFFWLAKRPKTAHAGLMIFGVASLVALVLVVRNPVGWFLVGALGAGSVVLAVKSSPHAAQVVLAFMAVQLSLSVFSRGDYLF